MSKRNLKAFGLGAFFLLGALFFGDLALSNFKSEPPNLIGGITQLVLTFFLLLSFEEQATKLKR